MGGIVYYWFGQRMGPFRSQPLVAIAIVLCAALALIGLVIFVNSIE
jgi:hypothetical protein